MDLTVLPTLCALTVFVFCFRPLVRRVGPHTDLWFVGWTFLLVHYCFLLFPPSYTGLPIAVSELICRWMSDLCGLCFLLAANNAGVTRASQMLMMEIAAPLLLQSWLIGSYGHSTVPRVAAALLLLGPALHLLARPGHRARPLNAIAGVFAVVGVAEALFFKADAEAVANITLGVLFLSTAYLTSVHASRGGSGVALMSGGLAAWGLSYAVQSAGWLHLDVHVVHTILDIPRYAVAAGTIMSLLDEYFHRTENLALHDPLTGLPNRRLFDIRLDQAIRECQLTRTPIACLVIDVDKFKYINDTFGHPVGDGLLQALSKRLSWNLGPRDMLARTGGDEFTAILVEAADEYHVRFIAGAMMAAGCVPVSIQQHLIDVRISIGIAVAPRDAIGNAELHRVADEAMYRAKRRGGGGVAFAHEEMGQVHAL